MVPEDVRGGAPDQLQTYAMSEGLDSGISEVSAFFSLLQPHGDSQFGRV